MAGTSGVSTVYIHVIDDVITKVRDEFLATGAGEAVLTDLQQLWELKMMQCGAISGTIERPPPAQRPAGVITPVHDLNVPYEGPVEEYETPTAEMLFPPTPMQTPGQTPLPGMAQTPLPGTAQTPLPGGQTPAGEHGMYNIPTGGSDYGHGPVNGVDFRGGRANPYMPPPSPWMNQRPLGVDVNVAYVENHDEVDRGNPHQPMTQDFFMMSAGKRKRDDYASQLASGSYIPQQDGSGDVTIEFLLPEVNSNKDSSSRYSGGPDIAATVISKGACSNPMLPQQDGVHDEYDDIFRFQGVANEDYNINTPGNNVDLRIPINRPLRSKTSKSQKSMAKLQICILLFALLALSASCKKSGDVTELQIGVKSKPEVCEIQAHKGDRIKVHYRGKLTDGQVFDSSFERGDPFEFELGSGQVIKGWDQGLLGMCVGEKRKLKIPAKLGYGAEGSPPTIPGGATLIFDTELVAVNGKTSTDEGKAAEVNSEL